MNQQQPQNPAPVLNARFFVHTWPDPVKSREAGRPIYDELECVEVTSPGDKLMKKVFPAHSIWRKEPDEFGMVEPVTYAMRFPDQYRAFKDGRTQTMAGTPLEELPFLAQSKRFELKALGVHTAEQLASLDGHPLKQLGPGGREMKNQAQAFIDKAAETADVTKLAAENEGLRQQLEALQAGRISGQHEAPEVSPFADFDDEALKEWIKDATGKRPVGNPSHATLIRMADEINADLKAKAEKDKEAA